MAHLTRQVNEPVSPMGQVAELVGADTFAELTFQGQLEVAYVSPYTRGAVRPVSLGGEHIQVDLPKGVWVQSVTAALSLDGPAEMPGFQRAPRGTALFNLLGDSGVLPEAIIGLGDGLLAHFGLDLGPEASTGFSIWQGPHSEVFSTGFETFEQALGGFAHFRPQDSIAGAVLTLPSDVDIDQERITIDCVDLLLEIHKRKDWNLPPWEGLRGNHVELYRLEAPQDEAVLIASPSAVGVLSAAHPEYSMDEVDLSVWARDLNIEWL